MHVNRPLHVLIVEDSPDDAELICLELREAGYEPVPERVDSAAQMAAALNGGHWDVVIADHTMPTFDAPQALRLLQSSGQDLPFIIVSGSINEEVAVAAMRAGAHDFVMKDRLTRLATAVARELREADVRSQRRRAEQELRELKNRAEQQLHEQAERLQILSRRLLEAQETERRAVARELHDEIGQVLTAVKIHLQALMQPSRATAGEADLRESIDIVEHAIQLVRDRSMDLRPALLDDFGLVPAIRWYLDRHAARAGFKVELNIDPHMPRAAAATETACFRIIQEAVTNAMRHARATELEIRIDSQPAGVRFAIRDNGVGFNVNAARHRALLGGSIGLAGMQERVEFLGGTLEINSSHGRGTRIEVFLPWTSPGQES
jgi:signal transduction histidine kinase